MMGEYEYGWHVRDHRGPHAFVPPRGVVQSSTVFPKGAPPIEVLMASTGGTGHHLRLCLPVADAVDGPWIDADMRDRRRVERCSRCGVDVWYDPRSTVYEPGESIVCTRACLPRAIRAGVEQTIAMAAMTGRTAHAHLNADSHITRDPHKGREVQRVIIDATPSIARPVY